MSTSLKTLHLLVCDTWQNVCQNEKLHFNSFASSANNTDFCLLGSSANIVKCGRVSSLKYLNSNELRLYFFYDFSIQVLLQKNEEEHARNMLLQFQDDYEKDMTEVKCIKKLFVFFKDVNCLCNRFN